MAETSTITFIIINDFHKKARENNKSPRVSVSVVSLAELLIFLFHLHQTGIGTISMSKCHNSTAENEQRLYRLISSLRSSLMRFH